jgi:hypothetical protein
MCLEFKSPEFMGLEFMCLEFRSPEFMDLEFMCLEFRSPEFMGLEFMCLGSMCLELWADKSLLPPLSHD